MTNYRALACSALGILFATLVSCSKEPAGPDTYPVTGLVTLAGQPVESAVVQFSPSSAEAGNGGAQALTAADGKFELFLELEMGQSKKQGLPAGAYRVTVMKLQIPDKLTVMSSAPKNLLPAKYGAVETTPLTATVKAESENYFEFPL